IGRQDKDFQFAAAVAGFGMILRDSPYKGTYTLAAVKKLAAAAKGKDPNGYRAEFIALVKKARKLKKIQAKNESRQTHGPLGTMPPKLKQIRNPKKIGCHASACRSMR
ncbi:MAG: DUF3520 domain-containing protein, partial [Phycisphaerae bacterium]|nr:DUF3520 domain-containing protein [Phycisphaerae bacterium]